MDLSGIKDCKTYCSTSLKANKKELLVQETTSIKYLANLKESANHQNITPRGLIKTATVQNFLPE
jgi:hypothetical protein